MIGRLIRVPLRDVWPHEAIDFTRWLQENADVLSDLIGVSLDNIRREQAAGAFSVDLVAEDEWGNLVVIENQLEQSDHDHLGKLITYLVAFEAKTAVWIVKTPRPEHIAAVTWLNQTKPARFFMLKLEAVRIGDSLPAPMLTLIVEPTTEGRAVGEAKRELAEHQDMMRRFWESLLHRARGRTLLHADVEPGKGSWLSARLERRGLWLNYIIRANDARVELYIDTGAATENRALFDQFFAAKAEIEIEAGEPLVWSRREGRQACKVELPVRVSGYRETELWTKTQDAMIDAMVRFERALRPCINRLGT